MEDEQGAYSIYRESGLKMGWLQENERSGMMAQSHLKNSLIWMPWSLDTG